MLIHTEASNPVAMKNGPKLQNAVLVFGMYHYRPDPAPFEVSGSFATGLSCCRIEPHEPISRVRVAELECKVPKEETVEEHCRPPFCFHVELQC